MRATPSANYVVFLAQIERRWLVELIDFAVDACTDEPLRHQVLHQLHMFALAIRDDRREQHEPRAFWHLENLVDHLADGLRLEVGVVIGATWDAGACIQQPQVVIYFGDGADGRAWVMRRRLLLD